MPEIAEKIIKEAGYTRTMQQSWRPLWQSLADYELPSMADFTDSVSPGQMRGSKIINSTGRLAARELSVRINGFLTGDGTNWFDLRIPDSRVEKDPSVREWLDQAKRTLYSVFNSPGSGFGTAKEPIYKQLVVFGNAPLFVGETPNGMPMFRPAFLGNCSIWNDDDNRPTALFREYQQTAWGLAKQFGMDALPYEVKKVLDVEPQRMFTCIHAVRPRMADDPFDISMKPWYEAYVLKDGKHLLKQGGYWEFPWLFPRWNVSPNETYGRGPGEDALQDVKQLQSMDQAITKHVHMNVDPQWLLEDEGAVSARINQVPGGYAYGKMNAQGHWNIQRLGPTGSAAEGMDLRADIIRTINKLFYLDAFKMVEKVTEKGSVANMSATEFAGRQADQLRHAGPAVERLRSEFLYLLLARTVSILLRNGKLAPPPARLRGYPIHPEYVSPLAVAQRATERSAVLQLIGDIIPLAQVDSRALDIINIPRAGQTIGRALHIPQEVLNSPSEIAAIQKSREEAANRTQQMEQMANAAGAAKDNAQAMQMLQ